MRNPLVYGLILGAQLTCSAHAANFAVNSSLDVRDSNLSDGWCATAQNNCSLRAAIAQANALQHRNLIWRRCAGAGRRVESRFQQGRTW